MKTIRKSYAAKLADLLVPMAADIDPPNVCWINPDDSCEDYCRPCAEKAVAKLQEEDPDSDVMVDGGWGGTEEDSPSWCAGCGCLLDHSYTNEGVKSELDHWSDPETEIRDAEDAYLVLRMLSYPGVPILTESCGDFVYMPEARPAVKAIYQKFVKRQKALATTSTEG
jgi:hypothetical protein